jgi:Cu(I)/Ag(I) efflux system membrane protein CusA/SilA
VILLYILGFNMSVAVWVGFIAVFGVATDDAVVLVSAINNLFKGKRVRSGKQVGDTIVQAGLLRVRPIMMTTVTTILALIPVMLLTGTGSEVMKPMASPTIGGLVTATLSNLFLVPVLYAWMMERKIGQSK